MEYIYETENTCASQIKFEIDGNVEQLALLVRNAMK